MDQVVGDVDPRERAVERAGVRDVAAHDLGATGDAVLQLLRAPRHAAQPGARRLETLEEPATDVAAGSRQQDQRTIPATGGGAVSGRDHVVRVAWRT